MRWLLCLFLLVFAVAHAARHKARKAASANSSKGVMARFTKTGNCGEPKSDAKTVWIIKQWHLSPKTITKGFKEKYPQERNQTAIYEALAADIKNKNVQLLVAEGCDGQEIDSHFSTAYNGWNYGDLHKVAQTKAYDKILTHVPLKLESRFDSSIKTMCGDSDKLIQEGNLRLSNLRGWMGFWTRLHETYVDDKGKMYGDAAADLLKIPRTTKPQEILNKIHERLVEEVGAFKQSLNDRNAVFVKTLQGQTFDTAAIVIGGLHAEDLKNKVQAAGFNCVILEPPGYQREDEQLVSDFEKAISTK